MTRHQRIANIIALCILVPAIVALNVYSPPAASCPTPAANWLTLVACKTAIVATSTPTPAATATSTPAPTLTPVDTPQPLLIRSDGRPFVCEEDYTWVSGDDWMFVLHCQPVHPLPTPTRITP